MATLLQLNIQMSSPKKSICVRLYLPCLVLAFLHQSPKSRTVPRCLRLCLSLNGRSQLSHLLLSRCWHQNQQCPMISRKRAQCCPPPLHDLLQRVLTKFFHFPAPINYLHECSSFDCTFYLLSSCARFVWLSERVWLIHGALASPQAFDDVVFSS